MVSSLLLWTGRLGCSSAGLVETRHALGKVRRGILCDSLKAGLELALTEFQHFVALSQFRSNDGCEVSST